MQVRLKFVSICMSEEKYVFLTSWIKSINVDGQVDWFGSADTVFDLLDDSGHSDSINLSGLDNLKPTISVIFIVTGTTQSCSDTSMNVGIVGEQAFLGCMVEVGTMVNTGDLAWRPSKDFWLPCIKMRVKMDHRYGTVSAVD